jgi:hypothetical protein
MFLSQQISQQCFSASLSERGPYLWPNPGPYLGSSSVLPCRDQSPVLEDIFFSVDHGWPHESQILPISVQEYRTRSNQPNQARDCWTLKTYPNDQWLFWSMIKSPSHQAKPTLMISDCSEVW